MSNMIPQKTKTIALISLLVSLLVAVTYSGAVFFLQTLQQKFTKQQEEIARIQTESQELSNLSRLLEETEDEREELRSYVIRQSDIIDFLALIEELGSSHGATVTTASLNVIEGNDSFGELHVSIRADGTKSAVLHVLELLETLPYKSHVSRASLTETGGQRGTSFWTGTFDVVVAKHKE